MSWLIFVAIAILADVFRVYIDNYVTDVHFKGRLSISQRILHGFAYVLAAIILALIFPIDFSETPEVARTLATPSPVANFFLILASGVFISLAGIPYYRALECDDSTNLGIFFQFAPVLYLFANALFFGDKISLPQLLSVPIILAAPCLIILTTKKRSRHRRVKSMLLILTSILIEVAGNLVFVNISSPDLSLTDRITPLLLGHGLANITMVLAVPKWRKRFFAVAKKDKLKVLVPLGACSLINIAKITCYRLALILAPSVALASAASDAISPIAIFFAGILLTLLWPKFGREELSKKSILVHLLSSILIAIGIVIMQL